MHATEPPLRLSNLTWPTLPPSEMAESGSPRDTLICSSVSMPPRNREEILASISTSTTLMALALATEGVGFAIGVDFVDLRFGTVMYRTDALRELRGAEWRLVR